MEGALPPSPPSDLQPPTSSTSFNLHPIRFAEPRWGLRSAQSQATSGLGVPWGVLGGGLWVPSSLDSCCPSLGMRAKCINGRLENDRASIPYRLLEFSSKAETSFQVVSFSRWLMEYVSIKHRSFCSRGRGRKGCKLRPFCDEVTFQDYQKSGTNVFHF